MKRTILLSLVFCYMAGNILAQQDTVQKKPSEWSRWSVQIKGGIDVPKGSQGFFKISYFDPEFGIGVERTFNSLFGLGIDYMYMKHSNDVFDAHIQQIDLITPVNVSNLLSPCRSWQKLNVFLTPGLGLGFGSLKEFTHQGVTYPSVNREKSLNVTIGLGAEYDISSHFAVGLDGQFRWNSNTHHVPKLPDVGNKYGDYGYFAVNLSVRYKFAGKDNIRNINQLAEKCLPVNDDRFVKLEEKLGELEQKVLRDSLRNKADEDNLAKLKDLVEKLENCCEDSKPSGAVIKTTVPTTVPAPVKITLRSIYYKLDKWDLLPESYQELNKVVEFMQKNPDFKIEIGSHTDSRGDDAYNLELSNKRAQSVVNYLASKGIDRNRMTAKGYGETQILNRCKNGVNCSEAEHAVNRRTEFIVLNANENTIISSELIDHPTNYDPESVSNKPASSYASTNAPAYVIVGSFSKKENAVAAVEMLSKVQEKAEIIEENTSGFFRVGIPCSSVAQAKQKIEQLKSIHPDAWILK